VAASPLLFYKFDTDVLLNRLRQCDVGCKSCNEYYGCMLYADDIMLISHTMSSTHVMLQVCDNFASEYDLKLNNVKSAVTIIDPCFNVDCASLTLVDVR